MTLSKPALMSRKRVETSSLGLWRVLISCMRVREASEAVSPGREPHWFGWRSLLNLAIAANLTVITGSRIFEMVLRRTMIGKEAGAALGALAGLSRTTTLVVFSEGGW